MSTHFDDPRSPYHSRPKGAGGGVVTTSPFDAAVALIARRFGRPSVTEGGPVVARAVWHAKGASWSLTLRTGGGLTLLADEGSGVGMPPARWAIGAAPAFSTREAVDLAAAWLERRGADLGTVGR